MNSDIVFNALKFLKICCYVTSSFVMLSLPKQQPPKFFYHNLVKSIICALSILGLLPKSKTF